MAFRQSEGIKRYMAADFFAALISWIIFFILRKTQIEQLSFNAEFLKDSNFWLGTLFTCGFWWLIFTLSNTYDHLYRKSRIAESIKTILISFGGSIFLFFLLILDDLVHSYTDYYKLFGYYFLTHVLLTLGFRLSILFKTKSKIAQQKVEFPAVWVGEHPHTANILQQLKQSIHHHGIKVMIYISENESTKEISGNKISGNLSSLKSVLENNPSLEYAIIALTEKNKQLLPSLIELADEFDLAIKILPEQHESFAGKNRLTTVVGTLLTDVDTSVMLPWEKVIKRAMDVLISGSVLLIIWPLLLLVAWRVKKSSAGPVFFHQERIGRKGKPFKIYKFRSMVVNAEANGPQLSKEDDSRITSWGKIMRKYRIDELPQFYNILIGDMSLVGPRPERAFYAAQILEKAPEYKFIYKVRPGLTSWGMVQYGYASDVPSMMERMKYDLLYIENYSLLIDLRIMIYTILIILKGRGV